MMMTPDTVSQYFTRSDGSYLFARWGRPIAPVVFGVDEAALPTLKGAIAAVVAMAGHEMAETDPELGVNLMLFFCADWDELPAVKDLDRLVPELADLVVRLKAADANQYRIFRFDAAGAIKACFVFLRMDQHLATLPADTLALSQAVQSILLWSDAAFQDQSPLALLEGETAVIRPEVGALIRASYDPVMPAMAQDPSHALRLSARMQIALE